MIYEESFSYDRDSYRSGMGETVIILDDRRIPVGKLWETNRCEKVCRYVWSKFGGLFGFARVCSRFEEALVQRRHPGMKRRSGTVHATYDPVWGFSTLVTAYPIPLRTSSLRLNRLPGQCGIDINVLSFVGYNLSFVIVY